MKKLLFVTLSFCLLMTVLPIAPAVSAEHILHLKHPYILHPILDPIYSGKYRASHFPTLINSAQVHLLQDLQTTLPKCRILSI